MRLTNFNALIVVWWLGIILTYLANQYDQKNMIEKGYINNIFLGKVYITHKGNK